MQYDYTRLKGRIVEKFSTQARFARAMEMSERSMSLKMKGKRPWKQEEISRACEMLAIEDREIPVYFFTIEVQRN